MLEVLERFFTKYALRLFFTREMPDVKLKVDSPMLADYLAWLFPPSEEGGPLKVTAGNSMGRLLVAHCHVNDSPGDTPRPILGSRSVIVSLDLPNDAATKPLCGKWLWYPPADTAALNMAIRAIFDIEFNRYYLKGRELGYQKKDIVTAFIVSRNLFSTDCFDSLHKRVYRRSQQTLESLKGKLLRKAHYIDSCIDITGLKDD